MTTRDDTGRANQKKRTRVAIVRGLPRARPLRPRR